MRLRHIPVLFVFGLGLASGCDGDEEGARRAQSDLEDGRAADESAADDDVIMEAAPAPTPKIALIDSSIHKTLAPSGAAACRERRGVWNEEKQSCTCTEGAESWTISLARPTSFCNAAICDEKGGVWEGEAKGCACGGDYLYGYELSQRANGCDDE